MKRNFLYLAVLTLLAVLAVWAIQPEDGSTTQPAADTLLLPEISKNINHVDRVEIISAGNTVVATLVRNGPHWQVEQMGGYRADWPKLQALLAALAQARVVEKKTDKPEYFARLGVEDVTAADAAGMLVKLGAGDRTTSILIGHQAQGRAGRYVRPQNAPALLADRNFEVFSDVIDWADSTIVDISASEVAEVEIIHSPGQRVFVARISADQTDFDLVGLPAEREIKSSWALNSLGSVLSDLQMETVRPAGNEDWSKAVKMRLLMFSGVELTADMIQAGDEQLLRLHASHPAAKVFKAPAEADPAAVEQTDIDERAAQDIAKIVEDINQKTGGWVYGISKQKFDAMIKKPEDLLKPRKAT